MPKPSIDFLPEERVLRQSGPLVLTSHRVRLNQRELGRARTVGMTLDAVASCGLVTASYPIILALGVAMGLVGIYVSFSDGREELTTALLTACARSSLRICLPAEWFSSSRPLGRRSQLRRRARIARYSSSSSMHSSGQSCPDLTARARG